MHVRYPVSDIVVFSDLNTERHSGPGKKFFLNLSASEWTILDPPSATRLGYGNQRDSSIDFFFLSTSISSAAASLVRLEVATVSFPSDHRPLVLSINFSSGSRRALVSKVKLFVIDNKALGRNARHLSNILCSRLTDPDDLERIF